MFGTVGELAWLTIAGALVGAVGRDPAATGAEAPGVVTPGSVCNLIAGVVLVAAALSAPEATPSLFKSLIFFANSATRLEESLA